MPPTETVREQMQRGQLYRDLGLKRAFDLIGATLLMVIFAPLIAVLWLMVRSSGAPGFYAQQRIGLDGRVFHCWKLRSMKLGAAEALEAYLVANPVARAQWDAERKLTHDPRITRLGGVLRRYSLDELPQLWNVIRGEMSLVGPRPVPQAELALYGVAGRKVYQSVRPGITGLWQVSGRNSVSYEKRIALDMDYCANISMTRDVLILVQTIFVVIRPTGL